MPKTLIKTRWLLQSKTRTLLCVFVCVLTKLKNIVRKSHSRQTGHKYFALCRSRCFSQMFIRLRILNFFWASLTLILRRSRTGTVWFYTSTSNKRAARPKLYTVINKGLKAYVYSPHTGENFH